MRHIIISMLLFLLFSANFAVSQENEAAELLNSLKKRTPTIAIFPLENSNDLAEKSGYGQTISSMLNTHLRNETNFLVLERSQLKKIVDEKSLKDLGVTQETRTKLKKLYSVEVILTGEASFLNGTIQIDTRLISTESGQVVVAEYAVVQDLSELRSIISQLAKTIEIKYLRQWMGNLKVSSYPIDGEVYLDGQFMGKTNGNTGLLIQNLLEGSYKLKVMAGGYRSHVGIIEIKPRTNRDMQVILESLPGKLSIQSEPIGAEVILNNKRVGVTPLNLDTLEEGKYEVKLRKKNFLEWSEKITIQSGQLSEIKGLMEVIPGEISVSSTPSNALVYVDDIKIGLTPLIIQNKKPGGATIKIVKSRYQDHVEQIQVKPGEMSVVEKELQKLKGTLTLVSSQSDVSATISLENGTELFSGVKLPMHKTKLDIGKYVITLQKEGFYTYTRTIKIKANSEVRIDKELKEKPARISLQNSGATPIDIFVDGKYLGNQKELSLDLARGDHTIMLVSIYKRETLAITVNRDEHRVIPIKHQDSRYNVWTIPLTILAVVTLIVLGGK